MTTNFIRASNGDLISVDAVAHAALHQGRSRIGAPARAVLVLANGETVTCDRVVLDKGGALADWPIANGVHLSPATIVKVADGVAIGKHGEALGRVTNLDALVADATPQPPDPPPTAGAAPPVGANDIGGPEVAADKTPAPRLPHESTAQGQSSASPSLADAALPPVKDTEPHGNVTRFKRTNSALALDEGAH
jgi:hypothetical protein